MNRSTFRTIKCMNGPSFSKAMYMNEVGFGILARTPVPQLPPSYSPSPPPPHTHTRAPTPTLCVTEEVSRLVQIPKFISA